MTNANVDGHSSTSGPTEMAADNGGGNKQLKSNTNASMLKNALKKMEKDKVMNDLKNMEKNNKAELNTVSSKITKKAIVKE